MQHAHEAGFARYICGQLLCYACWFLTPLCCAAALAGCTALPHLAHMAFALVTLLLFAFATLCMVSRHPLQAVHDGTSTSQPLSTFCYSLLQMHPFADLHLLTLKPCCAFFVICSLSAIATSTL